MKSLLIFKQMIYRCFVTAVVIHCFIPSFNYENRYDYTIAEISLTIFSVYPAERCPDWSFQMVFRSSVSFFT